MRMNVILVAVAALALALLLSRRIRTHLLWRATVTPLASIIGSGFLVIVPLLGHSVGGYSWLAMLGIVIVAYCAGSAIRFNIRHVEPLLADETGGHEDLRRVEVCSDVSLAIAYFISVAFYLRLLSAFVLRGLEFHEEPLPSGLTTALLLFLGTVGVVWGLSALEKLEGYSVSVKLAIIVSLILGWALHDAELLSSAVPIAIPPARVGLGEGLRILAGVLIVVQGFETSRYLGEEYDPETRIRSMRWAQLTSGAIYLAFVGLALPTLELLPGQVDETAMIDLAGHVAPILPAMLVLAAAMSQFSAAIADMVGGAGLLSERSLGRFRLPSQKGYAVIAGVGIVLVWTANVFEIISLASRAFAFYYALQALAAVLAARSRLSGLRRTALMLAFGSLSLLFLVAAVIAIPAE